ncbi:MAG: hypothetical protein V3V08_23615 [Nannocystaceae bacterium]
MSSLEARVFDLADYGRVFPVEQGQSAPVGTIVEEMHAPADLIRTLYLDGEPVALAGITEMWPGVGRVWVWLEDAARGHVLSLTRIVKRELIPAAFEAGFMRLEADIAVDDTHAINWIEVLGFHHEATLKHRGHHGEGNQYLYVRFADGLS